MHQAVLDWLTELKDNAPHMFHGVSVLECGSLDINGTPRRFFTSCEYTGIDWRDGPGVDIVSMVHKFKARHDLDVVISTEMLEHDPYWSISLANMVSLLKTGGDLILTFGGKERREHEVDASPVKGYYKGLSSIDVIRRLIPNFRYYHIYDDENDVYIWCEEKL